MKWASAISENLSLRSAIGRCAEEVISELDTDTPDLLLAFVSSSHRDEYDDVPGLISDAVKVGHLIGCSGGGVIGNGVEVENRPAFAMTGAHLPGVDMSLFHVEEGDLPSLDDSPSAWEDLVQVSAQDRPHFVVLPDPFTISADSLILGLDYAFSDSVKIGGLASGGMRPGTNALFLDGKVYRSGAVGLAMHGNIRVDTIVAQGCRPIGQPLIVTKCQGNVLQELDEGKPLEVLRRVFDGSNEHDQGLINTALHVGVVMDPLKAEFGPGDFLIRNVMGLHQETGALVVGEILREGQVVQFHVRDARTAEEDLNTLMERYVMERDSVNPSGALLFSCLGRGENLFGRPNHDSDAFLEKVSRVPLTGFFCNGEIGQVGGTTFLHGFTSSFAMFTPSNDEEG
ncbi:MAG: FIST N-terminal domain-containing protein [Dehalococcoidia bacterium]